MNSLVVGDAKRFKIPQTELAMRGSGGFLGTGERIAGPPGPELTKKVAVARKRCIFQKKSGCGSRMVVAHAQFSSHSRFF